MDELKDGRQISQKWEETVKNTTRLDQIKDVITEWKSIFDELYSSLDKPSSRRLADGLGAASRRLSRHGYAGAAIALLVDAWKRTSEIQADSSDKIYRAAIAFYLAEIYIHQNDYGAAFWWQLHALADDYLHGGNGGGARKVLEMILGVHHQQLFSDIESIATENQKVTTEDWNTTAGFSEDVVTKLITQQRHYAAMFAKQTSVTEYPISPGYLSKLLADVDNDLNGKLLEKIACYLFLHIPGCTPAHNLLDQDQTMQTDVLIRNGDVSKLL